MVLRRYGSVPWVEPVVSWFARFSAITRRRVVCTSIPRAEIVSAFVRSIPLLPPSAAPGPSGLRSRAAPDRGAEHAEICLVEIADECLRRVGIGHLRQLLVQRDRIAVGRAAGRFRFGLYRCRPAADAVQMVGLGTRQPDAL